MSDVDRQYQFYNRLLAIFGDSDLTGQKLISILAPRAILAEKVLLTAGQDYYYSTPAHSVLYGYTPFQFVITWTSGKSDKEPLQAKIETLTVKLLQRSLMYVDFVKRNKLPEPVKSEQNGPLSDILHYFAMQDDVTKERFTAIMHQAVWAGDAVGIFAEMTLKR